jgi:hypothetical protein
VHISPSSQNGKSGRAEVSKKGEISFKHIFRLIAFFLGNHKMLLIIVQVYLLY